jgi:hypothetical protein
MTKYDALSDDFYVNVNLNTEMELTTSRDTVLHYFEMLRKKFPAMSHFYTRDRGDFVLEEDKESGSYRWSSIEPRRICSGYVNPTSIEAAVEQHRFVLESVPFALSVSPLDCESLNFLVGFDYTYRGNQNQLVAEVLGVPPAYDRLLDIPGANMLTYEPTIQFALDDDCRLQCRVNVESRTSAYHVRSGEYPEEQLSVYVTARRFGSLDSGETFADVCDQLREVCLRVVDQYVVDNVLLPLQQAISIN